METAFRKFSKRRLSLTFTRNKAIEAVSDTKSERGALSSNEDSDSDSVAYSHGYDNDDESIGMFVDSAIKTYMTHDKLKLNKMLCVCLQFFLYCGYALPT